MTCKENVKQHKKCVNSVSPSSVAQFIFPCSQINTRSIRLLFISDAELKTKAVCYNKSFFIKAINQGCCSKLRGWVNHSLPHLLCCSPESRDGWKWTFQSDCKKAISIQRVLPGLVFIVGQCLEYSSESEWCGNNAFKLKAAPHNSTVWLTVVWKKQARPIKPLWNSTYR